MSSASNSQVLVTGATGFVGCHVALAFLQAGYPVRGTARSQDKADAVSALPEFQQYAKDGKLTYALVEDLVDGDFTEAAKGCKIVAHTASPFHMNGKDHEKDYLLPAKQGTLNVLKAAEKAGTVTHFVVTSSFAAVLSMDDGLPFNSKTYTEKDWNNATYESACEPERDPGYVYCASKKVAEEAAYDYVKEHQLKLTSICPPLIVGPGVHPLKKLDQLNTSSAGVWALINGSATKIPETAFPQFVDVREVAQAHLRAVQTDAEGRFLTCAGSFSNESVAVFAAERFGDKVKVPKVDKPEKEWINKNPKLHKLDTTRAQRELDIKFRSFEETYGDMIEQLIKFKAEGK